MARAMKHEAIPHEAIPHEATKHDQSPAHSMVARIWRSLLAAGRL
jgi:hypothetical protein